MNDTMGDKQRHTATARKRLYVHTNTATSTNTLSGFERTLLD
ncbi:hypothetical protein T03_18038 [Trichinella britovi]|uniref:Uncharacterized protein n=1 Tax=Trichinella britovi TaxID=45882 RepID=A0A0V1AJ95_TRIBR|nr:hypothetical protein T03_18038 [Trichinella britovi]